MAAGHCLPSLLLVRFSVDLDFKSCRRKSMELLVTGGFGGVGFGGIGLEGMVAVAFFLGAFSLGGAFFLGAVRVVDAAAFLGFTGLN